MKIMVNGQAMDVAEGLTLEGLLRDLSVRMEYTAVALNREVAKKSEYGTTLLRENDRVEIVHPMGGG
jgi:sulfur carrier protein